MTPVISTSQSRFVALAAASFALCVLAGCSTFNHKTESKPSGGNLGNVTSTFIYNAIPPGATAGISTGYSAAINGFSVNLLDKIYSSSSYLGKNVVISPFCVSRNLAIITEATTGASQTEILNALGGRPAWCCSPGWLMIRVSNSNEMLISPVTERRRDERNF